MLKTRVSVTALAVFGAAAAYAHAPVFTCSKAGARIHCEAGYSDGASAANRTVTVLDENHKVLFEGSIKADGTYDFDPPAGAFHVFFDGGKYHEITLYSSDIS